MNRSAEQINQFVHSYLPQEPQDVFQDTVDLILRLTLEITIPDIVEIMLRYRTDIK